VDVSFLVDPLNTALWLRPIDVMILASIWVFVLGRRVTRSLRAVIVVAAGEAMWVLSGLGGLALADTMRALLLFLVLTGTLVFPWLLSGMDRADFRYHLALVGISDPTRRAMRRWSEDLPGARVAVARAGRKLEALPPPGPQWERIHSLLLDYYRNMERNYEAGGGEAAPGWSEAAELLPLIRAEWERAWRAVTPFRR
jgi:hypothetical protein